MTSVAAHTQRRETFWYALEEFNVVSFLPFFLIQVNDLQMSRQSTLTFPTTKEEKNQKLRNSGFVTHPDGTPICSPPSVDSPKDDDPSLPYGG
ncbi:hypothetical protein AVEN_62616-1 [Araneus ventricosus]|uniref:Uncharacterized protein n=1 Tax=Araneus ventricosus TaxID=182803 RepID=A0A4Y2MTE5_ARAVE|nr:hypothetical protein AVEN_62616-1 [Araneus ventricosus]